VGGEQYAARVADFARAMKKADPSIKLLSSYPSDEVVRNAGDLLDFLCPHHYGCADLGAMERDFDRLRGMIGGRKIHVAVTEWNTTAGDWGTRRAMLWTLENALACSRYHNLMHRNADLVEIANRSNLINSFCSGIIQTDNHRLYKTPTYYAQQLYATLAGSRPLKIESTLPADMSPDISGTLSRNGKELVLFAVNDSTEAVTRPLDLSAFSLLGKTAEVWTLADTKRAGEPDVTNSFGEPQRVVPARTTFKAESPRFTYRFPPLSLTVIRWRAKH
jgi:alpha-L-arabinofuranosidase